MLWWLPRNSKVMVSRTRRVASESTSRVTAKRSMENEGGWAATGAASARRKRTIRRAGLMTSSRRTPSGPTAPRGDPAPSRRAGGTGRRSRKPRWRPPRPARLGTVCPWADSPNIIGVPGVLAKQSHLPKDSPAQGQRETVDHDRAHRGEGVGRPDAKARQTETHDAAHHHANARIRALRPLREDREHEKEDGDGREEPAQGGTEPGSGSGE